GPEDSLATRNYSGTEKIRINPDLPGEYRVQLYAKDRRDVCNAKIIRFGVTVNTPYAGALAARKFSVDDAKKFSHLNAISADKTWEYAQGEGVTIAIIDSGVNYNHPDISQNIKINLAEIPGNGKDDDKNGFVDDAYGYDFASEDEFPLDDSGHGTHVASLAASAVFGVAPKAKILPIKVFNAFGGADMGTLSAGIRYAVDMGADVINCSLGMRVDKEKGFPEVLESALEYAKSKNVIVAAAAGNGDYRGVGYDIDRKPYAPASSTSSNVVSVASTKRDGSLASYSNFGRKTVDLGAPGGSQVDGDLLGAHYLPEIRLYEGHSGTSMATPVVSGTFALLKSIAPKANHQVLIDTLIESGVEVLELKLRIKSGKMIDTLTAVRKLKSAIEKQAEQSTHSMDLSAR
ncbi:MAG: S8 family serine peptidase, partial [Bdellovibrionales bacterium]|nr:S8 family serine peptidase [Bdellovibrionales bacterium]